jgi:hypothetical protein
MKREILIYSILGIFTCLLIFYQFKFSFNETDETSTEIKRIKNAHQVHIDLNCNIFIVEGEEQNILFEGPEKKIQQIQTISDKGCIRITQKRDALFASIFNILHLGTNDVIVYVTIDDLDRIRISNLDGNKNIKYTSAECLGLFLDKGQKLVIESKFVNNCIKNKYYEKKLPYCSDNLSRNYFISIKCTKAKTSG